MAARPARPAIRVALAYMAASATLFATMNVLARSASASASWATVGAVRAMVGAGVAILVARIRGSSLAAVDRGAIFWRSVFGTLAMLTTFAAVASPGLALGDTVTLLNLTPVFLAVLAPIVLRERTSGGIALAIGISLVGVVFVVKPPFLFGGATLTAGSGVTAATATMSALFTAIAMMMLRRVGQRESAEAIALHFSVFAAAVMIALSFFDFRRPSPAAIVLMLSAGLCGGLGQLALTRAYTLARAARVSVMGYLSIVVSTLLGALALHEQPAVSTVFGMGLVIAGGCLVTFAREEQAE